MKYDNGLKEAMYFVEYIQKFFESYDAGIQQVITKVEIWNRDISTEKHHKPIETIKSRIKSPTGIIKKLEQKQQELTMSSVYRNVQDIGGIRIICPFLSDVYCVAEFLEQQGDIHVEKKKDYIEHPKPNGYRSLHMLVNVPVCFMEGTHNVPLEIQIRTVGMDSWASLEHQLCYKKGVMTEEIYEELKYCAEMIADNDIRMQKTANKLSVFSRYPSLLPMEPKS